MTETCFENAGIYLIKNLVNGKEYVGQTRDLVERKNKWANDLRPSSKRYNEHIKRSFAKYGEENFDFSILDGDCDDQFDLNTTEIYYIWERDSYKHGYNQTEGGMGRSSGFEPTEETKRKQSEAQINLWKDPEYREKQKEAQRKGWSNPEKKLEASKRNSGKNNPRYGTEGWNKGLKCPKQSEIMSKKWKDPEYKLKHSEACKIDLDFWRIRLCKIGFKKTKKETQEYLSVSEGVIDRVCKENINATWKYVK